MLKESDKKRYGQILGGLMNTTQASGVMTPEKYAAMAASQQAPEEHPMTEVEQQLQRVGEIGDRVRLLRNRLQERLGEVLAGDYAEGSTETEARPNYESPLGERIARVAEFLEVEAIELQRLIGRLRV